MNRGWGLRWELALDFFIWRGRGFCFSPSGGIEEFAYLINKKDQGSALDPLGAARPDPHYLVPMANRMRSAILLTPSFARIKLAVLAMVL